MTIYELKVEELETVEEVKAYYKKAADELATAEEDMLFDEDGFNPETIEHVRYLRHLVSALRSRVYELATPALSDEVIDLYLDNSNQYTICEHDKSEPIGTIEYKEENTSTKTKGRLKCSIKREYRENSYSLRALRLVGEELSKIGVFNVLVTSNDMPDIEEFAGMSLEGKGTYGNHPTRRHSSR